MEKQINLLFINLSKGWGKKEHCMLHLINHLSKDRFNICLAVPPDSLLYKHREHFQAQVVPYKISHLLDIIALFRLIKIMFKHNTQVVCTYANRENTLVGIVCRFSGAKMIRIQQTYPLSTQTFAYNFCHRIIVSNQFIYNTLLFNGISQDTINIIPELISKQSTKKKISSINLRKHFNIDAKTLVLGVVESLRYVNRHRDIIEAFTHIKKERSAFLKAKLLIIGSGPQKILIKELIAEKDMESDILLSDSITFTSSMYRELDCLIVPSLIESSGYNILAAYQANVPVIVSDAGCLKEYVEEEVTGLIFKKGDAIDLEKKIKTLIDRSDLRRKMSEYIPQYIEEYFSPYKLIQTYEKLFTSILK